MAVNSNAPSRANACAGRPHHSEKSPLTAATAPSLAAMEEVRSKPPRARDASAVSSEGFLERLTLRTKMWFWGLDSTSFVKTTPGATVLRDRTRYVAALAGVLDTDSTGTASGRVASAVGTL